MVRFRLLLIERAVLGQCGEEHDSLGEAARQRARVSRQNRNRKRRLSEGQLELLAENADVVAAPQPPQLTFPRASEQPAAGSSATVAVPHRIHSSHLRVVECGQHWMCCRCGAQVSRQGMQRFGLLARPCQKPTASGRIRLRQLDEYQNIGAPRRRRR